MFVWSRATRPRLLTLIQNPRASRPRPHVPTSLNCRLQASNFLRCQMPKFPRKNIELQRPVTYPFYFFHMMPDGLEHLPDLPVLAFDQRNFVPGIVGFANRLDLGGRSLLPSAALALNVNTGRNLARPSADGVPATLTR